MPFVDAARTEHWFECAVCGHLWTLPSPGRVEESRAYPASPSTYPDQGAAEDVPKVLVIDDVEATRSGLAQLLQLRGYHAREAADGEEGLRMLHEHPGIRVIILDLLMPGTNGYWFRERQLADANVAAIPVIVFTGVTEAERLRLRLDPGDVLMKPVAVDQLFAAVNRHCRHPPGLTRPA